MTGRRGSSTGRRSLQLLLACALGVGALGVSEPPVAEAASTSLTLTVPVSTLRSAKGQVFVAVYERRSWLVPGKFKMFQRVPAQNGTVQVTIADIPGGRYALAVFHDENGNGKVDTNWLGLPSEGFGFSRVTALRVPSFDETSFDARRERTMPVRLRY